MPNLAFGDSPFENWLAYSDKEFRGRLKAKDREHVLEEYWPYEVEFQRFCQKDKNVKGHLIKAEYWLNEKNQDYTKYLFFDKMANIVMPEDNVLCVYGGIDAVVPAKLIEYNFVNPIKIFEADHYFTECESNVANIVVKFIS